MKTWEEYYIECKNVYNKETKQDNLSPNIYDLGIKINPFLTDQIYFDQISTIQNKLDIFYQDETKYFNNRNLSLCLFDIFHFEKEIKIILENYLVPYLEKNIFGCYVQCQNIKIYKTIPGSKELSSWLWHMDNNPKEQIKVMIYLNDVDDNGPFKYLSKDNEGVKLETTKQDCNKWFPNQLIKQMYFKKFGIKWVSTGSRIPADKISEFKEKHNCKEKEVKGPSGTSILFDNNIIHKGTIPFAKESPTKNFRYAMTLTFQPINRKLSPILSRENTGNGWNHITYLMDPELLPTPNENRKLNI
tara:strand:+ start:1640 stop:2545 length:906 start_codon:yes stop_codon:yes gene_type:complete